MLVSDQDAGKSAGLAIGGYDPSATCLRHSLHACSRSKGGRDADGVPIEACDTSWPFAAPQCDVCILVQSGPSAGGGTISDGNRLDEIDSVRMNTSNRYARWSVGQGAGK